jgi:hypothetical protein
LSEGGATPLSRQAALDPAIPTSLPPFDPFQPIHPKENR